ncbi:MAG: porin [Rhodothermus sp.]|nr:porin [Rhodothermus sp.]
MRTRLTRSILALLALLLWSTPAAGQEQEKPENEGPVVHGFIRPDWIIQNVDDPFRDDLRIYHFLTRTRIYLKGTYEGVRYRVELGLTGPEAEIPVSRVGFWGMPQILQDFYADVPFPGTKNVYVRLGQFKVPAGAEGLTYSAYLPFVERSIVQQFVGLLRDYGVALHAYPGENLSLALAVQTGLGRSIPNRYLPEVFGFPFVTARLQFGPNQGHDLFRLKPMPSNEALEVRLGANVSYYKDVLAGHSTALRVWNKEKPVLLQSGWNPYIDQREAGRLKAGTLLIGGGDIGLGYPTAQGALWLEGQITYGQYENDFGKVAVTAVRAQATYAMETVTFGLRYALVQLDELGGDAVGSDPIHEVTPVLTYRLQKNVRIILDGSFLLDVPVAVEEGMGVYVLTDHPEEIGMETIKRQNVLNLRAAVQVNF